MSNGVIGARVLGCCRGDPKLLGADLDRPRHCREAPSHVSRITCQPYRERQHLPSAASYWEGVIVCVASQMIDLTNDAL